MQIRPVASSVTSYVPMGFFPTGPADVYLPSTPVSAGPSLGQVLKPVSNSQIQQYRFELPGKVRAAPAVGPDGSLYCTHSEGLTILGPKGEETGKLGLPGGLTQTPVVRPDGSALVCAKAGLYGVDKTGKVLFERLLGRPGTPPALGPDGRIYYGEHTGHLHCLDQDGKSLWVYETEPRKRDGGWPGHIGGELAVGPDGTVLLNAEGKLHIVGPDGTLRKKLLTDVPDGHGITVGTGASFASDGSILVSRATNRVECYEADGRPRWSESLDAPDADRILGGLANTTPRNQNDLVVVGASSGELTGLDLKTGRRLFQNDLKASMQADLVQISSDGTIYAAGKYSSNAHAVDQNGDRMWSFNFPARAERAFMASQGEKVFMVSEQGNVYALRSDTVRQQLESLPPGEDPDRHGIVVSDNAVIVGGVRVKRK